MKINSKIKLIITYLTLAVLVLSFTSNSSCKEAGNFDSSVVNSWGTSLPASIPQTPEDYVDEVDALNVAFDDMDVLLDELASAIEEAEAAIVDCGDITLDITEAIAANDRNGVTRTLTEGVEILALAKPVYENLLDAIEAVQLQMVDINSLIDILANGNQDTSAFDTTDAQDAVQKGESTAESLLSAVTALEDALGAGREFLGTTVDVSSSTIGEMDSAYSATDNNYSPVKIINFASNARYPRYAPEYAVNDLFVNVTGSNLTYQWYVSMVNSNTEGSLISGATSNTYKPITSTVGTFYYFCQVTFGNLVLLSTPAIEVEIYSKAPLPSVTITRHPISAEYSMGSVAQPLTVEATGTNLTYQWYAQEYGQIVRLIYSATKASYTPPTNALGTVRYFCTVTSTESGESIAANSQTAEVKVTTTLTLTSIGANTYYYANNATPTELMVIADGGTPGYTYQWYKNGTAIVGASFAAYRPATEVGLDVGITDTYYCVVTDSVRGTAQSETITLIWTQR